MTVSSTPLSRRAFVQAGAALGLSLADLLQLRQTARAAGEGGRAKSCILFFLTGGPAQQETFDPKPDAPDNTRGEFGPIATTVPGFQVCEHLPMLAQQAHRFSVIRSTWHRSDTHGVGVHYNMTGLLHAPGRPGEPQLDRRDWPCLGSVIKQVRGERPGVPAALQFPRQIGDQNNFMWGGQHAGFLGPRFDPIHIFDEQWMPGELLPGFGPPQGVDPARQNQRRLLLDALQAGRPTPAPAEASYERFQQQAFDVMRSGPAWRAFDLSQEPAQAIARYGDNRFGRSCLLARRLIEAGVGVVTVPWINKQSEQNFDTHSRHFDKMKTFLLPPVDRGVSALLEDLHQRGLLDETLVAVTGEFGRTPRINGSAGRDHWGSVYSTMLAGGGIQGGRVYGRSDRIGGVPADNPVHVSDFYATMYHALGLGQDARVFDPTGRPHYIVQGTPVLDLF